MPDDYVKRSDVHKAFQPKYAPAINRTFAAMINSVPAADVVEVVRCRDCVFGNMPCAMARYPDYFCADGKRKDGGQDDV